MNSKRRPFSLMLLFLLTISLSSLPSLVRTSSTSRIALHQENEFVDGRVHYEGRFIGEEASIPCEVNFEGCGQIYFLTWSKNVSSGWQRVFLYSETYQTAMGDFEASRVTLDASNITSHGLAVLNLKSVSIDDEGTYKCDVTYLQGSCPSLTYTKLFTLVTPGEPLVRVNGRSLDSGSEKNHSSPSSFAEVTRVGPVDEASMVSLECSSSGGRPLPDIKWFDQSHVIKSKITVSENPGSGSTVTSTAKFIVTRKDLDNTFTCSVSNNATSTPFLRSVSFDVRVKPLSLKIRGPSSPVVAGEMVSLTCTVEGARPAASITWFNRSELLDSQPFVTEEVMEDATFRTSSSLVFIASRYDHDRDFSCMGTNQVLKERNEVPLLEVIRIKVLYPPECKVRLLPKELDGHAKVECKASSSPPVTSFKWLANNQTVRDVDAEDEDSLDQRSVLLIRESSIESLVCSAKNMMGSTTCILQAHQMQVTAVVGEHASLPCELQLEEKCGPVTQITWSRNSSNEWHQILSESYHLKQQQKLQQRSKSGVTKKQFPPPSVSSSRSDLKFILDTGSSSSSTANNNLSNSLVFLKIKKVSIEDEATYKCDVVYTEPTCPSVTFTKVIVTAIPSQPVIRVDGRDVDSSLPRNSSWIDSPAFSFLLPSKTEVIQVGPFVENTTVVLDCFSSGGKPLPEVKWFNGSRQLPSLPLEGREDASLSSSRTKILVSRSDLTSVFSCHVTNNATVRPLVKWLVFDIHVEPTSLHVRGPMTPVTAGDVVSLTCIVEGARPASSITWFNQSLVIDPQPLPSTDVLSDGSFRTTSTLMFQASRFDHEREVSCVGTNSARREAGKSPLVDASSTKVFFIPECTVRLEAASMDGKSRLTCDVISSPPALNYTWIRGNKSLSDDSRKLLSLRNQSSLMINEDDPLEVFSCVVSNSIGSSKPCRLQTQELNVPSGWVRLLLRDENLIIVAAAAGVMVFIIVSSLVVAGVCVVRRKLKGLDVGNINNNDNNCLQRTAHHYSRDVVNHKLKSDNKIASILEQHQRDNESRSEYMTICDPAASGLNCSELKSPLIRNAYHTITLRPDGSPLLSDYMTTEGSDSPTSTSSSIQHFYERPSHQTIIQQQQQAIQERSSVHQSLHHLNIPLNHTPLPLPPERLPHRLLLQQRMQTLQHPNHHPSHQVHHLHHQLQQQQHPSPALPPSLQPLRQLLASHHQQHQSVSSSFHPSSHPSSHHTVYRSLTRNRSRFEYDSDFNP